MVLRKIDVKNPAISSQRILSDDFLSTMYEYQVQRIKQFAKSKGKIIEIGGAGGITKSLWGDVEVTDIRTGPGVDYSMDAHNFLQENNSVDLVFGLDVLHHLKSPKRHFAEIERVLKPGGLSIYIDPNWNVFSRFCFGFLLSRIHPEPYNTKQQSWELLTDDIYVGNQAATHNIFVRDESIFRNEFPNLSFKIYPSGKHLSYLFSGGVSTHVPLPRKLLSKIFLIEKESLIWGRIFGLDRMLVVEKKSKRN